MPTPQTTEYKSSWRAEYLKWFAEVKSKIRSTQIRAALAANATLIEFYYDLGRMIVEKQAQSAWGDKLVQQLSKDLQAEFPEMKGLSRTNLLYCKQFFLYFQLAQQPADQIVPQSVGQLQIADNKQNKRSTNCPILFTGNTKKRMESRCAGAAN
jgi:hypothetical protein